MNNYRKIIKELKQVKRIRIANNLWHKIEDSLKEEKAKKYRYSDLLIILKAHPLLESSLALVVLFLIVNLSVTTVRNYQLDSYLKKQSLTMRSLDYLYADPSYNFWGTYW